MGDTGMKWASGLSVADRIDVSVDEAAAAIDRGLAGARPDLVLAFVSARHRVVWDRLPELLRQRFDGAAVVGCSGGGVLASGREVEGRPALALAAAYLPGCRVEPFLLEPDEIPELDVAPDFWRRRHGRLEQPVVIALPDPFSLDAQLLVDGLDRALPDGTIVGGLASGARSAGNNIVFADSRLATEGAVGLVLSGDVEARTVVAQGCRPIGNPMFVTAGGEHVITELDGQRPSAVLHELFEQLSPADQELLRYSLFLGVVMRPDESSYRHGDFLIRNLIGLDPESGALAVAADVARGQVVQFHLRDASASAADLRSQLEEYRGSAEGPPAGALLFSCLGRGEHLFGAPDHDSRMLFEVVGRLPLAGFFCNGEIGPVQGATFVHGYTSSFALFSPR